MLFIILLSLFFTSGFTAEVRPISTCSINYKSNYDGDTVTVKFNSIDCLKPVISQMNIRIYGVDTPEIKGKCPKEKELAKKVKRFVRNRLSKGQPKLIIYGRDKYFRLLGDFEVLYYGKRYLLSDLLIKKGYAIRYYGGTKDKYYWCR